MSADKSFITLMMEGHALPDDIEDFVERWHEQDKSDNLADYLGMTEDEYRLWFHDPNSLATIAFARRFKKDLREVVNENLDTVRLAARSSDINRISQLQQWLEETTRL